MYLVVKKGRKKWATKSQMGKIDKFLCKWIKDSSNNDEFAVEEDNVEQSNKNLNVDNPIKDNKDVLVASNVDVDIDNNFTFSFKYLYLWF